MLKRLAFAAPLVLMLLLMGPAKPALSLEPSDGGLIEGDQDPYFGDGAAAFDEIDDFADAAGVDVDEEEPPPVLVRRGGIVGIWQYTSKHEGWFRGKLFVKGKTGRILVGRVKGYFKHFTITGKREMVGVVLDRKGHYRGTLKGTYGRRGWFTRWNLDGGRFKGKASAKFVVPYGRAGFLGKFAVAKNVFTEETGE